ncbi:alpha/beta fold hydrolase [Saccharopolyspora sp. WRP15-2]|uniref:Alpha/beta fold hydrolase n=1 Tax=Saccharopolyspora oryzae TaxID=2997343 RepID=A0ABT4V9B0_9PSEU|nr:alpha/beta fold hydrolase [Saccharopolyspora oryzae]MDA3630546.1 alpha/beta fold hydrolase [Saccharopolyspora oryzae]
MSGTTTSQEPRAGATPGRSRSRSRRRRITLLVAGGLATLLAWNTVAVRTETAEASGEQVVRVPGGDIHVAQSGPADAPAVVLLHGLAGSTAWWDPVLPALQGLHVVRIDLLGHGGSAKPTDGYGIEEQAGRVGAVLDRLGVRRATVVGHSTGGAVATSLAEQRRDLVGAVAVIDTGPRADAFLGESFVGDLMTTPVIGELIWRLRTDGAIRGAMSTAFTREVQVPDQLITDVRGLTYRSLNGTDEAVDAYLAQRTIPDRLADVDLPTLVIFGAQDRRWQPSSAQDYRRVPKARIEILDGVGHTPMFEDPDTTGSLLRDFATGTAPR